MKLNTRGLQLYEKETPAQMFFMWICAIFKNMYFVNSLLKQHVRKYAHVFFGILIVDEHMLEDFNWHDI